MTKTEWYKDGQKPIRQGVYERRIRCALQPSYQHWNGSFWGMFEFAPEEALKYKDERSNFQRGGWRGLAEKPE